MPHGNSKNQEDVNEKLEDKEQEDRESEGDSDNARNDAIAKQAAEQMSAGFKFKKQRLKDWQENEDFYLGRVKKTLKGRSTISLPIMSGYVNTLLAKTDDKPRVEYEKHNRGDLRVANKIQLAWDIESSSQYANWPAQDRNAKKLCYIYGRAIFLQFSVGSPEYKSMLEVVDPYDFSTEPYGGSDLNKHEFSYQDNVFRSKFQIKEDEQYDQEQIRKLISHFDDPQHQTKTNDIVRAKINRFDVIGLTSESNQLKDFSGDMMFRLARGVTTYKGKRYYITFEPESMIWLRVDPIEDISGSKMTPFVSWASDEDPFNFWSLGPADWIRPVNKGMNILFNQAVENQQKRNWGQRAYDSDVFPDPSQLEFRPSGLVMAKAREGKNIRDGIYEFQTPEVSGTIDLISWMDNFTGVKTGITSSAQGQSEDDKVGIFFGNLQQVADRLGLFNKSYNDAWEHLGIRYAWGLWENASEKDMTELIGEDAYGWDELLKRHQSPKVTIKVVASSAEMQANELRKKEKAQSMSVVLADPELRSLISPKARLKHMLLAGGWENEEIDDLMDVESDSNDKIIADASQAIQEILEGKTPKVHRSATVEFVQKILDFTHDNDLDLETFKKLTAYAEQHFPIIEENTLRRAREIALNRQIAGGQAMAPQQATQPRPRPQAPAGGTPGDATSRGLRASGDVSPGQIEDVQRVTPQ